MHGWSESGSMISILMSALDRYAVALKKFTSFHFTGWTLPCFWMTCQFGCVSDKSLKFLAVIPDSCLETLLQLKC